MFEREQLALDVRLQLVGLGAKRIGRPHEIDRAQRIVQAARRKQRPRAIERGFRASRNDQRLLATRIGASAILRAGAQRRNPRRAAGPTTRRHRRRRRRCTRRNERDCTHRDRDRAGGTVRGRNGSLDGAAAPAAGSDRRRRADAIDARQKRQRHVVRAAALHRRIQHLPRGLDLAALERRDAVVQQLFRLALLLGHRAARALDVRAGARVVAIEKQRARPDVDGLRVVGGEVMIEAGDQQALDLGVALGVAVGRGGVC